MHGPQNLLEHGMPLLCLTTGYLKDESFKRKKYQKP